MALESHLGRSVVVLAFYPGDFNPACDGTEAGIADMELFAMQRGVAVLAVSGDGVSSHEVFADRYNLSIPLLADTHGTVAAAYDLEVDNPRVGHLIRRAVILISPSGEVTYTWAAEDRQTLPPMETVRTAVDAAGGPDLGRQRYGLGYAEFVEGRDALGDVVEAFEAAAWDRAKTASEDAEQALGAAVNHFKTAASFLDGEIAREHAQLADDHAALCRQAANWFAEAAVAHAAGNGVSGEATRRDAGRVLERARTAPDPPEPTKFFPSEPPENEEDGGNNPLSDIPTVESVDRGQTPDGKTIDDAELEAMTASIQRQSESSSPEEDV